MGEGGAVLRLRHPRLRRRAKPHRGIRRVLQRGKAGGCPGIPHPRGIQAKARISLITYCLQNVDRCRAPHSNSLDFLSAIVFVTEFEAVFSSNQSCRGQIRTRFYRRRSVRIKLLMMVDRCQRQANPLKYLNYSDPIVLI